MSHDEDRTAARHLRGWFAYAFASEVFAVVGLAVFLPICLEQFARDNGVLLPDKTIPCTSSIGITMADDARCVVKLGWTWIDTASFSLYVYSASVTLQAITVISLGGIADHPPHRKPVLLIFAYLGAISALLFLAVSSSSPFWPLVGSLACGANVGFGVSVVAMNSYLPSLARETKEVRKAWKSLQEYRQRINSDEREPYGEDLSTSKCSPETAYHTAISRSTSQISAHGIALGYLAGVILLILTIIPVSKLHSSTFSLRLAIGLSGIWWAIVSVPAGIWLPGTSSLTYREDPSWSLGSEIKGAWVRLGRMLRWKEIKQLRNTFWYLAAWFLLSDGFATMTSTAVLFAKTALHMPPSKLILIGAITPISGIIGSLAWPVIQRKMGWSDLFMVKTLVALVSLIPLYGCLGFLPVFKNDGKDAIPFGGLTTAGEMYGLAVFFGFIYGPFQGYSRSLFSFLIPPGEESRWYGLYSITDKSSSFVGPLVVGIISDLTGNIRNAFFFLAAMMWVSLPLLGRVNVLEGKEDAAQYISTRNHQTRGGYTQIQNNDEEN